MGRVGELTGRIPRPLLGKVEVAPWNLPYLEAFNALSGSRPLGPAGPLPIPLSEMASYWNLCGWGRADRAADFIEVIQAMDHAWLEAARRKADEARAAAAEATDRPPPRPGGRRRA